MRDDNNLIAARSDIVCGSRHLATAITSLNTAARLDTEFETLYLLQQAQWWLSAAERKLREGERE